MPLQIQEREGNHGGIAPTNPRGQPQGDCPYKSKRATTGGLPLQSWRRYCSINRVSENLVKKIRLKKEGLSIDRAGILMVYFR
ncbi:MAG: hypothetical protein EAZ59_24830 [Oscillatoriales cyanobacterium]|nr:MAG: hypothetical protein EAZ59_24830 [Oscillatoriales cyanobacterium]